MNILKASQRSGILLLSILVLTLRPSPSFALEDTRSQSEVSRSEFSDTITFEDVPFQRGLTTLTVGSVTFSAVNSTFSIGNSVDIPEYISGNSLMMNGHLNITAPHLKAISFDIDSSPVGVHLFTAAYSNNTKERFDFLGNRPRYTVSAPTGSTIVSVNFDGDSRITLIDNITTNLDVNPSDPGAAVAAALNTRYNAKENTCPGNLPAYFCNGIIIRSVDNGNFNPWDPSPSAVKLGAVSFSYFRVDSYVKEFYRDAGFIFLPQSEAIAQGKGMDYLCIYAYDAGTIVGARPAKGCGLKPRSATNADLSTCAGQNATTVDSWYAFTKTLQNRDYQCSLSTQDATQFAVSYQVRAKRPPNMEALWNEMMVNLWPQNNAAKLPIEAFFYKFGNSTSLNDAKTFQTKLKNNSGRWVPVIALDLSKISGSPFSYRSADQAINP